MCYIRINVESYKGRTVPPQCPRCQQFFHVAANCQAPPVCANCAEEHFSWQCEKRFEPNFLPTCALCKIGDHGSKYRGCAYIRNIVVKEMRNKPQSEKLHTKPNIRSLPIWAESETLVNLSIQLQTPPPNPSMNIRL
jgi:hypothetical protein